MLKSNHSRVVAAILALSLALRWVLIFEGGQYFFSDEGRYETPRAFVTLALEGNSREAFAQIFIAPEHLGFKIIGMIPAFIEQLTRESLVLPALFFSFFSVLNIYLIYKIAQTTGATAQGSLIALIFAASSMSLLYFSRHLVPYDTAMTFGLLAILVALTEKPSLKTSLLCGILAFLCFITYNGYWALAGLGICLNGFRKVRKLSEIFYRGAFSVLGFFLPAVLLVSLAAWAGTDLLNEYRAFAGTVSQGSFEEGWSLPFEYFWHAEHFTFILFGVLSIFAIRAGIRRKDNAPVLWLGALTFLYLCLVIPSVFLHSFVVYGRLAREMIPFLILLSASGLSRLKQDFSFGTNLSRVAVVFVIFQAAWNYRAVLALTYPRDFAQAAQAAYSDFQFSEKRLTFGAPTLCQNNGYVAEYVKHFEIPPEPNPTIEGEQLLTAPHPDNFLPYQYEGYTPEERAYLREMKVEMRLYRVDPLFMDDTNPVWTTMKSCMVREE